ncbi:MAG: hypothetical protein QM704_07350 [Anaeromyxobacteraceae bacterium]
MRRGGFWDVSPEVTSLAVSVLLGGEDLRALVARTCGDALEPREDALRIRLLVASTRACALARAVEGALDACTAPFEDMVTHWPMIRIADWWSSERERVSDAALAALLWRLATSPGPFLEPLALRVMAHLVARLARGAREPAGAGAGAR